MRPRYVTRPCDNLGTIADLKRDRTWLVWDTSNDSFVADHDTRASARAEAAKYNAEEAAKCPNTMIPTESG